MGREVIGTCEGCGAGTGSVNGRRRLEGRELCDKCYDAPADCADCGRRRVLRDHYGMSAKCEECWGKRIGKRAARALFADFYKYNPGKRRHRGKGGP